MAKSIYALIKSKLKRIDWKYHKYIFYIIIILKKLFGILKIFAVYVTHAILKCVKKTHTCTSKEMIRNY